MKLLFKAKKIGLKTSLIVTFMVPILVFTLILTAMTQYQTMLQQETLINAQDDALLQISSHLNNEISHLRDNMFVFENNDAFDRFLTNIDPNLNFLPFEISRMTVSLSHLNITSELFYDIAIYNQKTDMVLTSQSLYDAENYFEKFNKFEDYSYSFWKNYDVRTPVNILKKSNLTKFGTVSTPYLPVVFTGVFRNNDKCIIIASITQKNLDDIFLSFGNASQASIYMTDMEGAPIFSWDITDRIDNNPDLFSRLLNYDKPFQAKVDKEKYIFVSQRPNFPYFKNCTITAAIPLKTLLTYTRGIWLLSAITILFMILLTTIYAIKKTNFFYSPIGELIRNSKYASYNGDEFDILKNMFYNFENTQQHLRQDISQMLPIVCEQKTIQFITRSSSSDADEILSYLEKNNIFFDMPYFLVFTIRYEFTNRYREQFDEQQDSVINYELDELIKAALSPFAKTFILHIGQNRRCVILNYADNHKTIQNAIEEYIFNLSFDKSLLIVYVGMSGSSHSFDEIQKLYEQATLALETAQLRNDSNLQCYSSRKQSAEFEYSTANERLIFNSLLANDYDTAYKTKQEILDKNIALNISSVAKRTLLYRLYLVGTDVLREKDLKESNCMDDYMDFTAVYTHYDISELNRYIDSLYKTVTILSIKNSKIDKQKVIDYINEHYQDDIHLELIAEAFHTSPKYISRAIKEILGISFQQYLANIRIEKAKVLLLSTDMSIKEIATAVGFNNQNTFLRSFDKLEGITPTTFRKNYQN